MCDIAWTTISTTLLIIIIISFIQYMKQFKNYIHTKMDYLNLEKKYINKLIKVDKYI